MATGLVGKFRGAVSDNRVRIPAKFRKELGDFPYAAPGTDGCFLLISEESYDEVMKNYMGNDPYFGKSEEMKEFSRMVMGSTFNVEIDSQGRLSLGDVKDVCEGIYGAPEIVFSGAGNYVEVWPAKVYDKRYGMSFNAAQFSSMIAGLQATLSNNK